MRSRRTSLLAIGALAAASAVTVLTASTADAAPVVAQPSAAAGATYVPVTPKRVVNTHSGIGLAKAGALAGGHAVSAAISATDPAVPSNASAVAVTITAGSATAAGYLAAYSPNDPPSASVANVQFAAGQTASDFAVVPMSAGRITLQNLAAKGSVAVVLDVSGYYTVGAAAAPGALHPVTPTRLVNTVTGGYYGNHKGAIPAHRTIATRFGGLDGIPTGGVSAVAVTLTVYSPSRPGSLFAFNYGVSARPGQGSLYFRAGPSQSGFAIVPVSSDGRMDLYNYTPAALQVSVDVIGYFTTGAPTAAGALGMLPGSRVYASAVGAHRAVTAHLTGTDGLPLAPYTRAVVTIIATSPQRTGHATVWQPGTTRPATPSLQFTAGQMASDVQIVPVSRTGYIDLYNDSAGAVRLTVDVHAYLPTTSITPPATSVGRYPNEITTSVTDSEATMDADGCTDGRAGSPFVLLDVGAQSVTSPLTEAQPGVVLAQTATRVPVTYGDLESDIGAYLDGYARCAGGTKATIAVGTNNDGAWAPKEPNYYAPVDRGRAWADVVKTLAGRADATLTVVGADDIEAPFASTELQAQQWENAYFAETTAKLIYNGDANDCPTVFGKTGGFCGYGWSQKQYYSLAHHGSQVQVLPQIYLPAEAIKWADIDATGDGSGHGGLIFAGTLTEHADSPGQLTAQQGWTALYRAISSVVATPTISHAVDIAVDA